MRSLLGRFREEYITGTDLHIAWSYLSKNGKLTVGIANKTGKELFSLKVREYPNGAIYWE